MKHYGMDFNAKVSRSREAAIGFSELLSDLLSQNGGFVMDEFRKELEGVINKHSLENASNTPDFILAQYLSSCLLSFDTAIQQRETWYGRDARPTQIVVG